MMRARSLIVGAWVAGCIVINGCGDDDHTAPVVIANSPTPSATVVVPPSATRTPTLTATAVPTPTLTPTAIPSHTATTRPTLTPTVTATLTPTNTPSRTATFTPSSTPTPSDTPTMTAMPTVTATPTETATPTVTNTLGPLGIRHFELNPTRSTFQVKIAGGLTIPLGKFQGQTNGQVGPAFLDLEAGQPNADGFVNVNIVGASDFIFVDATMLAQFVICIKTHVPVMNAGVLGCYGGADIGLSLDVDHHLGQVGVDGFTADQCTSLNGHVEVPYAACVAGNVGLACDIDADCDTSTGALDGVCTHSPARCTSGTVGAVCQKNEDCATGTNPGTCGMPHPGVCNGALVPGFGTGDTGPGELFIVPNPNGANPLNGLPIELGFESALPCGDEGPGMPIGIALTTGASRSTILNANNELGHTLNFDTTGENFSCEHWQEPGRGRLVLSAPALDQMLVGDVATLFIFASH